LERSATAVKRSNSSKPSRYTATSWPIQSRQSARERESLGAVTSLKLRAPSALVRITQRPPWWSASYSTSRSRGASTANSRGSEAGAQRSSSDTVLDTPMQMYRSSRVREMPM
jgi:hypothetical protein